jgi:uncharacterized protein YceK
MLDTIPTLLKGRVAMVLIVIACIVVISLGCAGVISWNSPVEEAAESILQKETGLMVGPSN